MGGKGYVIGLGYNTTNFRIPFKIRGENKVLKNDLTMRFDLTIRDNITIQRSIVEDRQNPGQESSEEQVTNGSLQIMIKPTIDYVINQRLNVQLYFNRTISDPNSANAYRTTMTEGGVQLRFSLSQ
jgi:cell surface protein SprA